MDALWKATENARSSTCLQVKLSMFAKLHACRTLQAQRHNCHNTQVQPQTSRATEHPRAQRTRHTQPWRRLWAGSMEQLRPTPSTKDPRKGHRTDPRTDRRTDPRTDPRTGRRTDHRTDHCTGHCTDCRTDRRTGPSVDSPTIRDVDRTMLCQFRGVQATFPIRLASQASECVCHLGR